LKGKTPYTFRRQKTYDACAAIGPCIYVTEEALSPDTTIRLQINRLGKAVFEGSVAISQIKRPLEQLASFVYRECSFPYGCLIMTGTGIVPEHDFTLKTGDEIKISIDGIGTLVNEVG
jgi:2-dehydro-3-deoxy-D-arabinonate dehydratase